MIVRILNEGQFDVPDAVVDELNGLDAEVEAALERDDDPAFRAALEQLLERVRAAGTPVPVDSLQPSDLVLPASDAHVDEVREMLGEEGLIPG